jgi:predicted DNA binding protein
MGRDRHEANNSTGVLPAEERETLRVAFEKGYFEVPRATTLVEVADELGRSNVEVSQQLRRRMGDVLRETTIREGES